LIVKFCGTDFPQLRILVLVGCLYLTSLSLLPSTLEILHLGNCFLEAATFQKDCAEHTIYELKVTECSELISIHIKCKIFRMERTACEKLHKCIVENQIAHARVADCSYLLKFEGTKNIEHLTIALPRESEEDDLYKTEEALILKKVCEEDPTLSNSLVLIEMEDGYYSN
jgi:hypothetical protein